MYSVLDKLRKCYPLKLELIPLLLIIFTFYIVISNYSALPNSIPTHFNAEGVADKWDSKVNIWVSPVLCVIIYLIFTFLNLIFAVVSDPRPFINLPFGKKGMAAMDGAQVEALRVFMNRSLFVLKIIALGMIACIAWYTVETALSRTSGSGLWIWLFVGAMLIYIGYMLWKSYRLTRIQSE